MRILWFLNLEYSPEMRSGSPLCFLNGADLRTFSLSRELIAQGHEVYVATNRKPADDPALKDRYIRALREQNFISGHVETAYARPSLARKLGPLALHPAVANRFLTQAQEPARVAVNAFVQKQEIDLCIFTHRLMFFLMPAVSQTIPCIIDWIDSMVLFWFRQAPMHLRRGQVASSAAALRWLVDAYMQESYYSKWCQASLTVSPVDKRCLDMVTRVPHTVTLLPNGVRAQAPGQDTAPIKNRLVFSGNMSYWPNHDGAVWFIDHVLPLVVRKNPQVVFVVAGARPTPELLARRSHTVQVTGFVEAVEKEIVASELYVAPLVSGGGFKNKIAEALAANRFVVGTSRAVEFLDPKIRSLLLVADTPGAMAEHILSYLTNPGAYASALAEAHRVVTEDYGWESRARELMEIARMCSAQRRERYMPDTAAGPA